jgi:hypothetical protein
MLISDVDAYVLHNVTVCVLTFQSKQQFVFLFIIYFLLLFKIFPIIMGEYDVLLVKMFIHD